MKKNNDNDVKITDISIYIAALAVKFKPAKTAEDTTHWFTTREVIDAIHDIDASAKVTNEQVNEALSEAGFRIGSRPGEHGLRFRWMFKEK